MVREARIAVPRGLPVSASKPGGDINGHHRPLNRIQMIDHLSVITSDLRIEPCAKNAIYQDVKLFYVPFHFDVIFRRGNRDDFSLHAVEDVKIRLRIASETLRVGKEVDSSRKSLDSEDIERSQTHLLRCFLSRR